MGAVTPARRKVDLGIWKAEKYKHTIWYGRTIVDIMKNPTYTGCIVYGRIPKSLYEGIRMHRAPSEEWRYVPDAHEPIVSQELFDKVQKMFADRAEEFNRKRSKNADKKAAISNFFKGKIYCGDCGKRMRFVKPTDGMIDQDHAIYVCGGYLDSGYRKCSRHSIRYPVVADAVFAVIREQIEFTLDQEALIKKMQGTTKEKNLIEKYTGQINHLAQELNRINGRREALFESFAEGILDEAEYRFAKEKYEAEAETMQQKLTEVRDRKKKLDGVLTLDNSWIRAIHEAESETGITDELVKHLIKTVRIYEDNRIEVELKYGAEKTTVDAVISEMAGA